MYDLLDELESALYSLQDAIDVLKHFPEEQSVLDEVRIALEEQRSYVETNISRAEDDEVAAMERDYYNDVI